MAESRRAVVSVEMPPDQFYSRKSESSSEVKSKTSPLSSTEHSSASATEVKSKPPESSTSREVENSYLSTEVKALSYPAIRPRGIVQALSLDSLHNSTRPLFFRQSYLNSCLTGCDRMYSTNIVGHHGCVNALAFSKGDERFLATGM